NQRETAAVLCGLLRSAPFLREQQVQSLKVETDNSFSAYNLNRGAAVISLIKLTDRILEVEEDLVLQISAFQIHEKENTLPYSLFKISKLSDYYLKEEILHEVLVMLKIRPSINTFSNRRNRKFRRFVSLSQDKWAVAQDCLSISWQLEVPYLHPPIPLIQQTLNKLIKEKIQALMILPYWPSQPWWSVLLKIAPKLITQGENADVLVLGGKMRKLKKHVPLERMMAVLLEITEEKNYSDGFLIKEALSAPQSKTLSTVATKFGEDIVKDQGNLMNFGSIKGKEEKFFFECCRSKDGDCKFHLLVGS
ncbi:MAG: hypothetical protein EZS28_040041, partial [Streblomastix strix]